MKMKIIGLGSKFSDKLEHCCLLTILLNYAKEQNLVTLRRQFLVRNSRKRGTIFTKKSCLQESNFLTFFELTNQVNAYSRL